MAWIKRNLFFVVGGVIALGLLGGAGFYIYEGWSHNADAFNNLNGVVSNLSSLTSQNPSPGNDKIDNTKIARDQDLQIRQWITNATAYFQPIPSIPPGTNVDGAAYSSALQKNLEQLQHEAEAAEVWLPQKFEFSFSAEKDRVTFAANGLNPLAAQLGEVKTLAEILFAARINALDSIQRVRVSDDDAGGPQGDFLEQQPITNDLSVITPYVVSIRCFTPELSRVLSGFATSPVAFIVKSVNVQRADASSAVAGTPAGAGGEGAPATMGQPAANRGGLTTILKEQLLRVTIEVDLVKLLPKT
jgi:hypothetical protein